MLASVRLTKLNAFFQVQRILSQRDERQPFARRKRQEQLVQFRAALGAAVQNLIGRVNLNFGGSDSARPLVFVNVRIEIPDTVHRFRYPLRAAKFSGQLVFGRSADLGMQ